MKKPTPPEGYRLVKGEDIKDRVPERAMVYNAGHWFQSAFCGGELPLMNHNDYYAIPVSAPMQDVETMEQYLTNEAKAIVSGDPYQVHIGGVRADPYRIARVYGINDPVIFQALKKLLRCGRKHKDQATDVREAITSLERWEAMNKEDQQ